MRGIAIAVLLAVVPLAGGPASARVDLRAINPTTAAECDTLVLAHPYDYEAYRCYLFVSRRNQCWAEAVERLESRLSVDPGDHKARLFLGWIEADRFRPRAGELLTEAARGFSRDGDPTGEVYARLARAEILLRPGRQGGSTTPSISMAVPPSRAGGAETHTSSRASCTTWRSWRGGSPWRDGWSGMR